MQAAYAATARAASPLLPFLLRRRAARGKELLPRLAERRGVAGLARPAGRLLWLHAASVGETQSILPVLEALADRAHVLLTTGTVTSARLVQERLGSAVLHQFAPLDVPAWAARFLDHWRPDAACFVESEIWPNLLAAARQRRIPMMLVNGRMSARSAGRWRHMAGFAARQFAAFDAVWAQSEADAVRLRSLGAPAVCHGNLKFSAPALPADPVAVAALQHELRGRPAWVAGSVHPGEAAAIEAVHARLVATWPDLVSIIVPRHPPRWDGFAGRRRSRGDAAEGLYLADTMGELGVFYRVAPIAFVGGSLVAHGGQNVLEPARLGCAVATGPHHWNFADAVARLETAGGLSTVSDEHALARWVAGMLDDRPRRAAAGAAARQAATADQDLPRRVADTLLAMAGA